MRPPLITSVLHVHDTLTSLACLYNKILHHGFTRVHVGLGKNSGLGLLASHGRAAFVSSDNDRAELARRARETVTWNGSAASLTTQDTKPNNQIKP